MDTQELNSIVLSLITNVNDINLEQAEALITIGQIVISEKNAGEKAEEPDWSLAS